MLYAGENGIDPTIDFVLPELERLREQERQALWINLFEALDIYIEERASVVSANQVKDYRTLRKHLLNFKQYSSQPISFRYLNMKFYNEFMDYLFYKALKPNGTTGLLTNSAGKIIRMLKAFVHYEVAQGRIPYIDLRSFKVVEEETHAVYLNEKELAIIHGLDLAGDKELEAVRDIFIVGCYTGLRYSDLSTISPEHVDLINGNINIKQHKVHKAVVIPMIDYVPDILRKYNYSLPKLSAYKFNERLKDIGLKAKLRQKVEVVHKKGRIRIKRVFEKWEMMSSHTCRRSFCTNMYLSGFPAEELMRISGHKSPAAFMRYIKVDNQQAANRLKELRAKRKKRG
jgi:integrase